MLVTSPNKARSEWSYARVVELCPGKDNKVRVVKVIKPDRSVSTYPINLLYPMELAVTPVKSESSPDVGVEEIPPVIKPKRSAAVRCLNEMKKCY